MSNKRRRSIDVDNRYIEELESIAKREGISTATGVAVRIVSGKICGFGREIERGSDGLRGISMTEAMWLAVRARGEAHGGTGAAMHKILDGSLPPLSAEEMADGERAAREREDARGNGPIKKNEKESGDNDSRKEIRLVSTESILMNAETTITRGRKVLSAGEPLGPKGVRESIAKNMNIDDESYGGYFQF